MKTEQLYFYTIFCGARSPGGAFVPVKSPLSTMRWVHGGHDFAQKFIQRCKRALLQRSTMLSSKKRILGAETSWKYRATSISISLAVVRRSGLWANQTDAKICIATKFSVFVVRLDVRCDRVWRYAWSRYLTVCSPKKFLRGPSYKTSLGLERSFLLLPPKIWMNILGLMGRPTLLPSTLQDWIGCAAVSPAHLASSFVFVYSSLFFLAVAKHMHAQLVQHWYS
jgi:hypothetical protein